MPDPNDLQRRDLLRKAGELLCNCAAALRTEAIRLGFDGNDRRAKVLADLGQDCADSVDEILLAAFPDGCVSRSLVETIDGSRVDSIKLSDELEFDQFSIQSGELEVTVPSSGQELASWIHEIAECLGILRGSVGIRDIVARAREVRAELARSKTRHRMPSDIIDDAVNATEPGEDIIGKTTEMAAWYRTCAVMLNQIHAIAHGDLDFDGTVTPMPLLSPAAEGTVFHVRAIVDGLTRLAEKVKPPCVPDANVREQAAKMDHALRMIMRKADEWGTMPSAEIIDSVHQLALEAVGS